MKSDAEVIKETVDYLCGLPDGSNLTMYQAVEYICPEMAERFETLDFSLVFKIEEEVNKTGNVILDFTSHDGKVEGLPFNLDFYVRKKRLQKVKIVSNLLGYGPCPEKDTPAEQRLTISSNGRYWFSEYLFGNGEYPYHALGRKVQGTIGKEKAYEILSLIKEYQETGIYPPMATDIGSWNLYMTELDGTKQELYGSLCGGVWVKDVAISNLIKNIIPVENLTVFGEDYDEEDNL